MTDQDVARAAIDMLAEVLGGDRLEVHPDGSVGATVVESDRTPQRAFASRPRRGRIGLAMIVRDEEAVIERCLDSVVHLIDTWTIVDTGSRDRTREIVTARLGHLPGELHERPWVDFSANRNELLDLSAGTADYLILLDADMEIVDDGFEPEQLTLDGHEVVVTGGIEYRMPYVVRSEAPWFYVGRTHEYLTADVPLSVGSLETLRFHHHADGGSRGEKFTRDRDLLERELRENPDDLRSLFYLAQTRQHLGDASGALAAYRRRIDSGGWDEEIFWSLYQCGRILEGVGDWAHAVQAHGWAWEYRPTRAEPLFRMVQGYRHRSSYRLAWLLVERATKIEYPKDRLFVERWIYDWGIDFERSILAWWVGERDLARDVTAELLLHHDLPHPHRAALESNQRLYMT